MAAERVRAEHDAALKGELLLRQDVLEENGRLRAELETMRERLAQREYDVRAELAAIDETNALRREKAELVEAATAIRAALAEAERLRPTLDSVRTQRDESDREIVRLRKALKHEADQNQQLTDRADRSEADLAAARDVLADIAETHDHAKWCRSADALRMVARAFLERTITS